MTLQPRRAIFLDRDGVLNRAIVRNNKPYPPSSLDELEIPSEVLPALQSAAQRGFLLVGVSNQPDVARGTVSREVVEGINRHLLRTLPLAEILICCHDDRDACACRKPKPGLLLQAAEKYQIDLPASFIVGDRWRDVEAGRRAGCTTVWIDYHYDEAPPASPDHTVASFSEAIQYILQTTSPGELSCTTNH
jgi:D-glycero-D-manno-heptose 1,7-bisphosphate phosphatase